MNNRLAQSPNTISSARTKTKRRVLQLIVLAALLSLGAQANAATHNVSPGPNAIQNTVNIAAAGDTILMAPGTYTENVFIDKRLTLQGAGSASTIIESAVANIPVITLIAGGDNATDRLVIQDVTIRGASGSSSHAGSGITIQPNVIGFLTFDHVAVVENSGNGLDINLFALLNDIVIRDSTFSRNGGSGFRAPASSAGINGLEITDSHFDSNIGGGFTAYSFTLTDWHISNSTFNDNVGANVPFVGGYGMYIEGHIVQDITIDCSEFSRNRGTADNDQNISSGLVLFPATAGDIYSNITIKSSQFADNPFAGILVQSVLGTLMQNISLECLGIERNDYGIAIINPGIMTGFSIHHSNFVGNTTAGLYSDNATIIDAILNWWGHASGPDGDGPGSGDAIETDGLASVTFFPFLTAPSACASTCAPAITIVKKTNGTDNDAPPGPTVAVGSTVNWTYEVTNTGNEPLSNVVVTDDHGVIVTCTGTTLAIGANMTCMASGTAVAGQYTNIGSVTGTPPTGPNVTASNPDNYFGSSPSITLVKKTNGTDNNTAPGVYVTVGSTVTWTYLVTNTGNVALTNVMVTDDKVGAICTLPTLAAGASTTCTKTGTALAGQYTNLGTVVGTSPTGSNVSATNPDNYFGLVPCPVLGTLSFSGNTSTSGTAGNIRNFSIGSVNVHASAFSRVRSGGAWNTAYLGLYSGGLGVTDGSEGSGGNDTHKIDNIGGRDNYVVLEFSTPVVIDRAFLDIVGADSDVSLWIGTKTDPYNNHQTLSDALLSGLYTEDNATPTNTPGSRWADVNAPATSGNIIIIAAQTSDSTPEDAFKLSKVDFGCSPPAPAITLVKKTNGTDNNTAPGVYVTVGSTVTWTYLVTNTGNVPLTNVTVTDNKVGAICTVPTLAAGASTTCTKTGTAVAGQYTNIGTVVGTSPTGSTVTATNPDNYFGLASCPAPSTLTFSGNTSTSGTAGNIRNFSVGSVNVHASAFSRVRSGGAWNTAYLGLYSGGLGVTDGSEGSGGNDTHKVDNIGGRDNYVLLEFSTPVVIDKAFLDVVGADSDVSVWIGTKTNPYTTHVTLSDSTLSGFSLEENSTADATPGSRWADLNVLQMSGNVVVIAALASDSSPEDAFKLSKVQLGCPPPPVCSAGTFYFSGNTATSGTAGNIRTFAVNGVTVNVSAFSRADSGGAWATSYLGLYSGGLGVTDSSEGTGGNNTHKVDNGGGRNNYVLFEFSTSVVIDQAYLDIIGADSDISTWMGTAPDPISNHLILSDALLSYGIREDSAGSTAPRWANINAGNVPANVLVISGLMGDTAYNDAFKISKLAIKCQ